VTGGAREASGRRTVRTVTRDSPPRRWSRRQWVLYGLFLIAVAIAITLLTGALDAGDREAAGVVALAGIVAAGVFVVWVVRLLRAR